MTQPTALQHALLGSTSISEEDLTDALRRQSESGRPLTDLLLELEAVPEGELLAALGALYAIPVRDTLDPENIDVPAGLQSSSSAVMLPGYGVLRSPADWNTGAGSGGRKGVPAH